MKTIADLVSENEELRRYTGRIPVIDDLEEEVKRLRALLARAADRLADYRIGYSMYGRDDPLRFIQELRKAAE